MADPLSIASGVASLIAVAGFATQPYVRAYRRLKNQQSSILGRNYGPILGVVITLVAPGLATQYERINASVIRGGDDEAAVFRQSVTDECNMTAVAGAIIAQVAITALSLPQLSLSHWVARAAFLLAVTSGCLSVYYAVMLQREVGRLYSGALIREWLALPSDVVSQNEDDENGQQRASLAGILTISAPFMLVNISIQTFLFGLVIYQGFVFTRRLDEDAPPGDSRNVFIVLMIGTVIFIIHFAFSFQAKDMEVTLQSYTVGLRASHQRTARLIQLRPKIRTPSPSGEVVGASIPPQEHRQRRTSV